ncbi:hypothetical protein NC652_036211 [Populus alba x Populus x berolinensis]|nr:hypothetical protein NC652_036211 [Populus alba x Populus x berolinensis]
MQLNIASYQSSSQTKKPEGQLHLIRHSYAIVPLHRCITNQNRNWCNEDAPVDIGQLYYESMKLILCQHTITKAATESSIDLCKIICHPLPRIILH